MNVNRTTTEPPKPNTRAVVLLSGGLGSHVAAARAASLGFSLHAITFNYGQQNHGELEAAGKIGQALKVADHVLVTVNLAGLAPSPLTGTGVGPSHRTAAAIRAGGVAPTYVPGRNLIFLALAAAHAETVGAGGLIVGIDADGGGRYPDCRGEFLAAVAAAVAHGTRLCAGGGKLLVAAPLLEAAKADVIRLGVQLGVDFSLSVSCYRAGVGGTPCGVCDACVLRRDAFLEAGVADPRGGTHLAADGTITSAGGIALPSSSVASVQGKILLGKGR